MKSNRYRVVLGFSCPASFVLLEPSEVGSIEWSGGVSVDTDLLSAELAASGRTPPSATLTRAAQADAIERLLSEIASWMGVSGTPVFWKDADGTKRMILVEERVAS